MPYKTNLVFTPDWMKISELAGRLGCHPKTVRNQIRRGVIPVRWIMINGIIHVNRAQYLAWLEGEDTKAKAA
ncbi:helix-turn-helix domain-containing protein [Streptomyces angustmyceticus]|uniref:helix-turn-helix domain-containing protein n=1 Tax=Streptomyces angustmyceticus TaxID=285578 RepID=UPI003450E240